MLNEDQRPGPAQHAQPGTPGNPLTLTDPRMMRALAHPARIAILQHLGLEGPATATECADVAGLSPSACSYHLRALARYGFVEEDRSAAADGRQRPWRARIISFSFGEDPAEPAAVRSAGRVLQGALETAFTEVKAHYEEHEHEFPAAWRAAAGRDQDVVHATPAEVREIRARMHQMLGDYRRLDPSQRPPGAGRVHVTFDLVPWFDPGRR